ncbi:MAG: hypothetical protein H6942_00200 [Candidatus Accumulibacter sp.]|uniref:hypothetical protein n=1 Tax=Accumulibacter sp. TaxID=2053492 RepID=UPI0025E3CDAA|nr:hypothetical protein [Accumulibacter sp.]MCP5246961.1 hypothetical protein [Accumulibacter sp.]
MTPFRQIIITLVCAMLAACVFSRPQSDAPVKPSVVSGEGQQLRFQLASGVYRCESGRSVQIQRDARNTNLIEISWQGARRTLLRYDSTSGLPRYEDRQHGLLWIDLPWKSVLMDANSGRPLANECKLS